MSKPVQIKSATGPGITVMWPEEGEPEAAGLPKLTLEDHLADFRRVIAETFDDFEGFPSFEDWLRHEGAYNYCGIVIKVAIW
jgi:hypothetical protein